MSTRGHTPRRLTVLLRREGWKVNAKRIYRRYAQEQLLVRTKQRRKMARRQRLEQHRHPGEAVEQRRADPGLLKETASKIERNDCRSPRALVQVITTTIRPPATLVLWDQMYPRHSECRPSS